MRLIDADAFDERVRAAGGMSEEELTEDFKDGVQAVLYMLSNQPTIQPEPHWIPVTIEPQEDDDYFVTLEDSNGNFTDVVSYDSVQGWGFFPDDGDDFLPLANVIAWMPLPEPYKGVTE